MAAGNRRRACRYDAHQCGEHGRRPAVQFIRRHGHARRRHLPRHHFEELLMSVVARVLLTAIALAGISSGAITNLRVAGITATQTLIEYTAPDTNPCTVAVSE